MEAAEIPPVSDQIIVRKEIEVVEAAGVGLVHGVENKGLGRFHFLSNAANPPKWPDQHA